MEPDRAGDGFATLDRYRGVVDGTHQPQVLYDTHVPTCFPPEAVLSVGAVRTLMIDFATTGEWSQSARWRITSA